MPAIVSKVEEDSIAQELEITAGDEILSIDNTKMQDLIDYNFLCKSEVLTLEVKKRDGQIEVTEIEKDYDEDLGIIFESAVFDRIKPCLNKCIFCFVDQQPGGLRETLYVKDDDYRLSYLQGTYITLTNLKDEDKERIKRMHLGPFYISVHTTNSDLRVKMLKNPNAAKITEQLKWFAANDIPFHAQIVLCPGYNDGAQLERTLSDLAEFGENLLSAAIVPVGLTKFRPDKMQPVERRTALETLETASKYKKVCCADEFFLLAGKEIPPARYYGNFSQLSDGVGTIRLLLDDFYSLNLPRKISKPLNVLFATSFAAKNTMEVIANELNKIGNLKVLVKPVKSDYWGEDITVAGLITSGDLIAAVKDEQAELIAIPSVMLKPYSEDFLDGKNLEYVRKKTGKGFLVIQNVYSVKEFVNYLDDY
ncbi:MAG: DUF512 domain-containing protein [Heliobacteriaceae bacterium]|jgi:putative radical SAM enzyme (TIGR03279 family)|nr:DUF512 domain-containing protein [Heliobacteriaceae bacterium]